MVMVCNTWTRVNSNAPRGDFTVVDRVGDQLVQHDVDSSIEIYRRSAGLASVAV